MRITKKPQKAKKKETKGGVFSVVEAEQKKSELWLKGHGRRQKAESRSSNVYGTSKKRLNDLMFREEEKRGRQDLSQGLQSLGTKAAHDIW